MFSRSIHNGVATGPKFEWRFSHGWIQMGKGTGAPGTPGNAHVAIDFQSI